MPSTQKFRFVPVDPGIWWGESPHLKAAPDRAPEDRRQKRLFIELVNVTREEILKAIALVEREHIRREFAYDYVFLSHWVEEVFKKSIEENILLGRERIATVFRLKSGVDVGMARSMKEKFEAVLREVRDHLLTWNDIVKRIFH